uniref:G-protein coupled receptors family 1 profile domain-containing protein n=1 Tax=Panagrolaimus sp. ES5 TaxID=591445 RepID=A0AC34FCB4_9BILA
MDESEISPSSAETEYYNPIYFNENASVWRSFLWRNHNDSDHCVLIQSTMPSKVDDTGFQLLFSALYFIVWFSAILGNLCVIYVVTLKQVTLSSVRSVFICSLAISDILMSLTSLPTTAITIFTRDWVFPQLFCKFMGVFQGGSIFVSSFHLTAIAVDRFILIRHPGTEIINFSRAVLIVIFIWFLGYFFALPLGIFSSAVVYTPFCGLFCDEICSVCYLLIGRIINKQIAKRKAQQVLLEENQQRLDSRKSRSSRLMTAMVGGLVLAWLPLNLINLWRDFSSDDQSQSEWYSLIFAGCHVIAMTSAAWNPIFYSWFNPQFRDTLKTAFGRKPLRRLSKRSTRGNSFKRTLIDTKPKNDKNDAVL